MKKENGLILTLIICIAGYALIVYTANNSVNQISNTNELWEVDFIDNFESFNSNNWQDQRIWVNNEKQCYVPNGDYNTREVSEGTLKIRVVKWKLLFWEEVSLLKNLINLNQTVMM